MNLLQKNWMTLTSLSTKTIYTYLDSLPFSDVILRLQQLRIIFLEKLQSANSGKQFRY